MKYGRQNGEVNQRTKIHILKWPLRTVQKSPPPMAAKNKLRYWRLKNCLISLFLNIVSQISIVKDYKIRFNTQRWTAMRTEGWTWVELGSFNAAIRHPLPTTLRRTILLVICIKIITMVIMVILKWHYWSWKWSWLHGKAWEDHEKPFPRFAVVMVLVMALNYWWTHDWWWKCWGRWKLYEDGVDAQLERPRTNISCGTQMADFSFQMTRRIVVWPLC